MMNIQQQTMSKTTSQADMMNIQQQTMSKTTSQADMMNIQQLFVVECSSCQLGWLSLTLFVVECSSCQLGWLSLTLFVVECSSCQLGWLSFPQMKKPVGMLYWTSSLTKSKRRLTQVKYIIVYQFCWTGSIFDRIMSSLIKHTNHQD
jgi:hypothetical protein